MFVLELEFDDNPQRLEARPAHRETLTALHSNGELVLAGPWVDGSGALLVFDVDRPRMDQIVADDAYYSTPGVVVRSLREWSPIAGTSTSTG